MSSTSPVSVSEPIYDLSVHLSPGRPLINFLCSMPQSLSQISLGPSLCHGSVWFAVVVC